MSEHVCACYFCRPGIFPPIPATEAPYLGVWNTDCRSVPEWAHQRVWCQTRGWCRAFLNGVDATDNAVEALAGEPGWMVFLADDAHRCRQCAQGLCQYVRYGRVEVRRLREGGWETIR